VTYRFCPWGSPRDGKKKDRSERSFLRCRHGDSEGQRQKVTEFFVQFRGGAEEDCGHVDSPRIVDLKGDRQKMAEFANQ
jgi:hypothetical protein